MICLSPLTKIIGVMLREISHYNIHKLLGVVTSHYRVPGSDDMVNVGVKLSDWLRDQGIEVRVTYFEVDGEIEYLGFKTPIAWNPIRGSIEITKPKSVELHRFSKSPTTIMTYSPSGLVEAEVVYVGPGNSRKYFESKNVNEKVVLAYGTPWISYRLAAEYGAAGFMYFSRRTRVDHGVPYASTALRRKDLEKCKIPAVSISRSSAERIINLIDKGHRVVVKIDVETRVGGVARVPIVEAYIEGSGNPEHEILLTAHLCHPAPSANDNASGVAAVAEGIRALNTLINSGKLPRPRLSIRAIWTAEYLGYLAYVHKVGADNLRDRVVHVVNLDMVGGSDIKTGSTLTLYRPPIPNISPTTYAIERGFEIVTRDSEGLVGSLKVMRSDISPYAPGSDHDIFNALRIPSVMIITWPDRYYHTDLDRIENLDLDVIAKCAALSISSAICDYSVDKLGLYFSKIFMDLMHRLGTEFVDIRHRVVSEVMRKSISECSLRYKDLSTDRVIESIKVIGDLMGMDIERDVDLDELVRELGLAKYRDVMNRKIRTKYDVIYTTLSVYEKLPISDRDHLPEIIDELGFKLGSLPVLLKLADGGSVEQFVKMFIAEYGKESVDKLPQYLEYLVKANLIELV